MPRIARFFCPYKTKLVLGALLALGLAGLSATEPLLYKLLFDAFGASALGRGASLVAALVGLLLAREVTSSLLDRLVWRVRIAVNYDLLGETIHRLHSLPLSHHREEGVGAVMTKVERGISGTLTAFSDAAFQLVPSLVYLVLSSVVLFGLEWRLALVVAVFAPLPAIVGIRAAKEQTERERALMTRWTKLFGRLNEILSGIAVVKSFTKEEDEKRRFLGGVRAANAIVVKGIDTDSRITATKNALMALARVATIAIGGWLVVRHDITLGTLVAVLGYVGGVFQPVQALTGTYQSLRKGAVAAEAVLSILDANDSLGDAPDAREVGRLEGAVTFEDVCFEYRAGKPMLRGVTLHAKPGETIALVGASGAGKSTLMALLQRLYDPTSGRILLDGQDLRSLKQRSVREQIGVVLQEGMLFSDTIADNIAFGCPGATSAAVEAAARAANAHDFVTKLERGYETPVGERGCKLSGGERQRIAIARALLKDAPILVLDEATSALDAETEEKVQEALATLRAGRTTFIIAHRLATIVDADRIVVLDEGRIVEEGTHAELLRKNGRYAKLYARSSRTKLAA